MNFKQELNIFCISTTISYLGLIILITGRCFLFLDYSFKESIMNGLYVFPIAILIGAIITVCSGISPKATGWKE